MLSIPPKALDTHHLTGIIGSPLEAGENMYIDLRDKYLETDYDYEMNWVHYLCVSVYVNNEICNKFKVLKDWSMICFLRQ